MSANWTTKRKYKKMSTYDNDRVQRKMNHRDYLWQTEMILMDLIEYRAHVVTNRFCENHEKLIEKWKIRTNQKNRMTTTSAIKWIRSWLVRSTMPVVRATIKREVGGRQRAKGLFDHKRVGTLIYVKERWRKEEWRMMANGVMPNAAKKSATNGRHRSNCAKTTRLKQPTTNSGTRRVWIVGCSLFVAKVESSMKRTQKVVRHRTKEAVSVCKFENCGLNCVC